MIELARKSNLKDLKSKQKAKEANDQLSNETIFCGACNQEVKRRNFYKSYNPNHLSGLTPFCKDCWFRLCSNSLGEVDKEKFKTLLMQNDKPYIDDLFVAAFKEHKTPQGLVGYYIKRIALQQFRHLAWADSVFEPEIKTKTPKRDVSYEYDLSELEDVWGSGFTPEELIAFEKKYQFLIKSNPPANEIHIDAIRTYVRYRTKADLATARDDVASASKWGAMAEKQQTIAKLSPDKLSKKDLSGGLDDFSSLFKEIENAVNGVIPLLPRYLEQPKDKADFIIYVYVNYNRNLRGLPRAEYSEIYEFYKRRAEEVVFADVEDEEGAD